jgi:hypothetical protein
MSKRNALDKSVFIFLGTVFLIASVIVIIKILNTSSCKELKWKITPENIAAGDVVYFKDETPGATSWKWDFGDSSRVNNLSNATHIFKKEGIYTVTLKVNGECVEVKQLKVNVAKPSDIAPVIQGPSTGDVGRPVKFKVIYANIQNCEWAFEQPDHIDSEDPETSFTFKSPGKKNIIVFINNRSNKATYEMEILAPASNRASESFIKDKLNLLMKDEFKFQEFKRYLCDLKIGVEVNNSGSSIPFNNYCTRLITNPATINSVRLRRSPGKDCIEYLYIEQK